jgi:hypothetical protein
METTGTKKVSRRKFIALALSVVMAVSMFALPLSASAGGGSPTLLPTATPDYYYVYKGGAWIPAPMGQTTVAGVLDNGDGTYTARLGFSYYYEDQHYNEWLIGAVTDFDGTDNTGAPFLLKPITYDGGYVTFNWDPLDARNYITITNLEIVFTSADNPDWLNPITHVTLSNVRFCPFGGPPVP